MIFSYDFSIAHKYFYFSTTRQKLINAVEHYSLSKCFNQEHNISATGEPLPRTSNRSVFVPCSYIGEPILNYVAKMSKCDGCELFPIKDVRFKCVVCEDFDLCGTCEGKNIHAEHEMKEIKGSSDFQNVHQFMEHFKQSKTRSD